MSAEPRVWCAGEMMWDFEAPHGVQLEQATSYRRVLGGAAANTALELRHLGHAVDLLGWLPDDSLGVGMRKQLAKHGVGVDALVAVSGRTGLVYIERRAPGEQRFTSHPARYDVALPPLSLPHPRAALHLAALRPDEVEVAALAALARQQRVGGGLVILDLNARPRPWRGRAMPVATAELWSQVHVVKASRDDLAVLGLDDSPQCQRALLEQLSPDATLVITRGTGPVSARGPWGQLELGCTPVVGAGSIGAGDAFCAGLIAARLAGREAGARAADDTALGPEDWRRMITFAQQVAAERLRAGRFDELAV
jgi:sugar/nucleoside kinase (ribokinase family)